MAHKMQLEMNLERDCTVPGTSAHSVRSVAFTLHIYTPYIMLYRAGHWHIYTLGQCVLCIRCTAPRHDVSTQWKRNPFASKWHCVCSTTPLPVSHSLHNQLPFLHTTPHTGTVAPPLSAMFLISAWAKY